MGHDKNGEFRLKGYNTDALIPSTLWNYFLKDGAIYGIVFSRPLTVNVNDPAQAYPTFSFECSKDMSVFDMRHRLFEKIVELQPLEGYWAPETPDHLVVQRLFSEAEIPDDHLLRDCVEWTPGYVNITVTGLVRLDDSVMQDDWILNGENIDEDNTADAVDANNTDADVGNTSAEEMDLHAAKEEPRSIEASVPNLPGQPHLNNNTTSNPNHPDQAQLLIQGTDADSDTETPSNHTPVSSKSSQAAPPLRCTDPYCPHEAPPASNTTGPKHLSIRSASKKPSELPPPAMDDEWVVPDEPPTPYDDCFQSVVPGEMPVPLDEWGYPLVADDIPTPYDCWNKGIMSESKMVCGQHTARKAPMVATREQPKRKVKRESLGAKESR